MNKRISGFLDTCHRALAKSSLIVRLAIVLRNQCRCVIRYHLNENSSLRNNGEERIAHLMGPTSFRFIDVGANVGEWSEVFATSMNRDPIGLLFDASDSACEVLRERFKNKKGIEIVNSAVGDRIGEAIFFEEPGTGETSSLLPGVSVSSAVQRTVHMTTLDSETEIRGWGYVDFLKIDTEGYDYHVLRGAANLLDRRKIGLIQFEYNSSWAPAGSTLAAALDFLGSRGYATFLLKSAGLFEFDYNLYGEFFTYSNFVAISNEKLEQIRPLVVGRV